MGSEIDLWHGWNCSTRTMECFLLDERKGFDFETVEKKHAKSSVDLPVFDHPSAFLLVWFSSRFEKGKGCSRNETRRVRTNVERDAYERGFVRTDCIPLSNEQELHSIERGRRYDSDGRAVRDDVQTQGFVRRRIRVLLGRVYVSLRNLDVDVNPLRANASNVPFQFRYPMFSHPERSILKTRKQHILHPFEDGVALPGL